MIKDLDTRGPGQTLLSYRPICRMMMMMMMMMMEGRDGVSAASPPPAGP